MDMKFARFLSIHGSEVFVNIEKIVLVVCLTNREAEKQITVLRFSEAFDLEVQGDLKTIFQLIENAVAGPK